MRVPVAVYLTLGVCTALGFTLSDSASAQVPESQPSGAVPGREAVVERAPAPTAAEPAEPAPVTAAPAATSPVGAAPPAKASSSQAATASTVPSVTLTPIGATPIGPAPQQTSSSSPAPAASGTTSFFAGTLFALALEGVQIAALKSTEGGWPTSDVVIEKAGPVNPSAKHLTGVRYDDITFTTSTFASKPLNDWIAESWKTAAPKSGSVASMDYSRNILGEREFIHAVITETTFPELDVRSKNPAYITVNLAPEYTRAKAGGGKGPSLGPSHPVGVKGSFRFEMAGLDGSQVSNIEAFTVRRMVANHAVGEGRASQQEPGAIVFPNLKITVAATGAQTWVSWHDDFVVKGKNSAADERSGAIVYFDGAAQNELGRISLSNCGIFKLTAQAEKSATTAAASAHVVQDATIQSIGAELYCERMDFVGKP
jgi:tail tube protein gp19